MRTASPILIGKVSMLTIRACTVSLLTSSLPTYNYTLKLSRMPQPELSYFANIDEQKRWLEPLGPLASRVARGMFALNRTIARKAFGLRVEGMENLPKEGPFVLTPNHVSALDPFAAAATFPYRLLRNTYWAARVGLAFGNPLKRLVSRLAQAVPIDSHRVVFSSLAFGA